MVKQIPMLATNVVSRRLRRLMARIARGTSSRPTATRATRNVVVLEIAMTAPANRLSRSVQPNRRPIVNPSHTMRLDCSSAVRPAVGPSSISLRRLNSRPSENIKRMTPSSESVWTTPASATNGIGTWGPTISPAMMYPNTTGWRRRWNSTVVTAATASTTVRDFRNSWVTGIAGNATRATPRGTRSRSRRSLVGEQLARGHPQSATQALDRIGPNEAKPPTRAGKPVEVVYA